MNKGFGYQQAQTMGKDEWLTPPELIRALGDFDLDPCSPINRPWRTAKKHLTIKDDGLKAPWEGRVWLNPPYGQQVWLWMKRLAEHKSGVALIFGRTGSLGFKAEVWDKAYGILFIYKRLYFYHADGSKAKHNSGGDSVMIVYSEEDFKALENSNIPGRLIKL